MEATATEGGTMFKVEAGVKGAVRTTTRRFATRDEAEAYAARVRRSNSIGSYWAEVTEVEYRAFGGGNPHTLDGWYPVMPTREPATALRREGYVNG
jgi:hypothetical protein